MMKIDKNANITTLVSFLKDNTLVKFAATVSNEKRGKVINWTFEMFVVPY